MLNEVMAALESAGVHHLTVSNVLGRGRQKGVTEIYRGAKEVGTLLKKIKIEIGVNKDSVEPTIQALIKGARTGEVGDGKIFVYRSGRSRSDKNGRARETGDRLKKPGLAGRLQSLLL